MKYYNNSLKVLVILKEAQSVPEKKMVCPVLNKATSGKWERAKVKQFPLSPDNTSLLLYRGNSPYEVTLISIVAVLWIEK